jgi:hypothetical protein
LMCTLTKRRFLAYAGVIRALIALVSKLADR